MVREVRFETGLVEVGDCCTEAEGWLFFFFFFFEVDRQADSDSRDIVDTEPATGNVLKMLLGATNKWLDGDDKSSEPSLSKEKYEERDFDAEED